MEVFLCLRLINFVSSFNKITSRSDAAVNKKNQSFVHLWILWHYDFYLFVPLTTSNPSRKVTMAFYISHFINYFSSATVYRG